MEYKDPGRYIPIIYLLYSWGSLFGVPSRVPLVRSGLTVPFLSSLSLAASRKRGGAWFLTGVDTVCCV